MADPVLSSPILQRNTNLMLQYNMQKKSPALAAVLSLICVGAGYCVAGRGDYFLYALLASFALTICTVGIYLIFAPLVGIGLAVHAYQMTEDHNRNLVFLLEQQAPDYE